MTRRSLPLKRKRFAQRYAVHGNGTQAAREAGYSPRSEHSLTVEASRLLRNADVVAEIQSYGRRLLKQAGVDTVEVTRNMERLALEAENETVRFQATREILRLDGAYLGSEGPTVDARQIHITTTGDEVQQLAALIAQQLRAEQS